jgi:DNA-binding response OmpR family regulator
MTVGYEPILDAPIPLTPSKDRSDRETLGNKAASTPVPETGRLAPLGDRRPLRFGGLSLDKLTGRVLWRGHSVTLDEEETETLQAFMRNAGRIVSVEQLAAELAERPERVERQVRSLHGTLSSAGVRCLPRRANGLGYILWY